MQDEGQAPAMLRTAAERRTCTPGLRVSARGCAAAAIGGRAGDVARPGALVLLLEGPELVPGLFRQPQAVSEPDPSMFVSRMPHVAQRLLLSANRVDALLNSRARHRLLHAASSSLLGQEALGKETGERGRRHTPAARCRGQPRRLFWRACPLRHSGHIARATSRPTARLRSVHQSHMFLGSP